MSDGEIELSEGLRRHYWHQKLKWAGFRVIEDDDREEAHEPVRCPGARCDGDASG